MTTNDDDGRDWQLAAVWGRRLGVTPRSVRGYWESGRMIRREIPGRHNAFEYAWADAEPEPYDDKTDPEFMPPPADDEPRRGSANDEYRDGHAPDPEPVESIEELLSRRMSTFQRSLLHDRRRRAIVRVERDGPFAVCHMGDPHVDDDGCDWPELRRDIDVVNATPNMYAGNVGDTVNNWVGKLIAKWKQQSTTETEAFRLGRWLFEAVAWDYIILGNHDLWNQGSTIFNAFAENASILAYAAHEARVEYVTPAGGRFRLAVRHDFKGHSQWNNQHGLMKRAKTRPWADLLICGHKHTWGHHSDETQPGHPTWTARVRGYKRMDEYAEAKDFAEDVYGCSLTSVIDPDADNPGDRCIMFHDVQTAADYLSWLRERRS